MQLTIDEISFLKQNWNLGDEIKFHRRVANFVYFAQMDGREVVLRLTEPTHRTLKEIESELHWLNFLSENGMQVAHPIQSLNGALAVEMPGENKYFAAVFEKAPGSSLNDEDINDELLKTWGQYLGKMHRLTQTYKPPSPILPRQQWEKDESLAMALRSMDRDDPIPYQRMNELLEWMRSLPQTENCYGLVHTDLHRGNFFVKDGIITAFDFDDSCYQWFSYDFTAPINSVHKNFSEGNKHPDKNKTLEIFLSGYRLENNLDPIWVERIKIFDKHRAALVYHWIKTFTKEGVFDAKAIEWAKQKAPKLLEILREPLQLF